MNKKIAILIPIKNRANTILRALNSVYEQTYFKDFKKNFIIYLVDDHSSDNLFDTIKDLKNIKYIKNKHYGLSAALNTGIIDILNDDSIDYIARLDSDDEWLPNKIQLQIEFLEKNLEIDICGTSIKLIGKTNILYRSYLETHDEIIKSIKEQNLNPICHPSVIINKRIFYYCGLYNDIQIRAEDFELWKRCVKLGCKFHNLQEILINVYGKEEDFTCLGLSY